LVRKPEGKKQVGRLKSRWKDNITVGCGLDSSASGLGQVAGLCEHNNELSNSVKGSELIC